MAITKEDVKLMESERMDDTDEGGGRMTGTEVIDGNVNNMFRDISRLDRVKGRVSMRKGFIGAFTENQDVYSGAHVVITDPADDALVSGCMFTTDDPYDDRIGARDRVESYVAQGSRFPGYLWGRHIAGARALSIIMALAEELPGVGDVLFLQQDTNTQYVRITDIAAKATAFGNVSQNVVVCGISDPLRYDFIGYEPGDSNKTNASMLYTTIIADAAKYFGVMRATAPINTNDTVINVDSIYTHLVPSAQAESPVVDVTAGSVPNLFVPDINSPVNFPGSIYSGNGQSVYFPMGAKPGTFTMGGRGHYYHTDGIKLIYDATGEQVGTIDHAAGRLDFYANDPGTINNYAGTYSYEPILSGTRIGNAKALPVLIANRGYNYVTSLLPLPAPGSVVVDYMAQGKWYTLKDDGEGVLRGLSGSGSVNYATGAVIVTCGALPDAGTAILFNWGAPTEFVHRGNKTLSTGFDIRHTVEAGTIQPGSLSIEWYSGGTLRTAIDDGNGNITGDLAGGKVFYGLGEIRFTPTVSIDDGSLIKIDSNSIETVIHQQAVTGANNSFTLPSFPIAPGTFSMRADYTGHGFTTSVLIQDDGAGKLVFHPGTIQINKALGHGNWDGSTSINPLPLEGTINYATGAVFFHGAASGLVKWVEITMTTKTVNV